MPESDSNGLQDVINKTGFITIDKRKVTAESISRSGHYKTAERSPAIYNFTVGAPQGLTYSTNRDLLQDLDTLDRINEANVDIGANNTSLSYITGYQGDANATIHTTKHEIVAFSGSTLYIQSDSWPASDYLFKKGDFIQPTGNTNVYRYPYQVTSDVPNASSSNISVPVHRPILSQEGQTILTGAKGNYRYGSDVRFHVKCLKNPIYSVVPYDLIDFDGDFELIEVIT